MKKTLFLLSLLLPSTVLADYVKIPTAESSIIIDHKTVDSCLVTTVEKYTRYHVYKLNYVKPDNSYYLITQNFETGKGCFEGYNPQNISVTANTLDVATGKIVEHPAWAFHAQAVWGSVEGDLYKTESPGCCSAVPTYKYYSLKTGKLVSSTTTELRSITNSKNRKEAVIGVEANSASSPEKSTDAIATIFVGNENGIYQEVSIQSKKYSIEDWDIESLNFVLTAEAQKYYKNPSNMHVNNDGNFKGISLRLVINCRCEHEPVNIILQMGENEIDIATSAIIGGKDISLN